MEWSSVVRLAGNTSRCARGYSKVYALRSKVLVKDYVCVPEAIDVHMLLTNKDYMIHWQESRLVSFYPEPRTQHWGHVRGISGGSCGWYVKSQHLSETASTGFSTCPGRRIVGVQSPECVGEWLMTTSHPPYRSPECDSERLPDNKASALPIVSRVPRSVPVNGCPDNKASASAFVYRVRNDYPTTRHLPHRRVQRLGCVSERLSDNKASASSLCPETGACRWTTVNNAPTRTDSSIQCVGLSVRILLESIIVLQG